LEPGKSLTTILLLCLLLRQCLERRHAEVGGKQAAFRMQRGASTQAAIPRGFPSSLETEAQRRAGRAFPLMRGARYAFTLWHEHCRELCDLQIAGTEGVLQPVIRYPRILGQAEIDDGYAKKQEAGGG
jgi:hypothetical protein